MTSTARQDIVWVGLDVHKVSISAAVICPGREPTEVTNLMADDASVRKFFSHLGPPERLRVVYEAGPTGYDLQRKLASMGISCQVAAPSLIPRVPGDKVKTDRRDAQRLARLLRSGDLVAIRVPTP
ncbi:MAG: IS110 family transposase, partial [Acidimicrobiales bacterium]